VVKSAANPYNAGAAHLDFGPLNGGRAAGVLFTTLLLCVKNTLV
jgi:hypothetical protein